MKGKQTDRIITHNSITSGSVDVIVRPQTVTTREAEVTLVTTIFVYRRQRTLLNAFYDVHTLMFVWPRDFWNSASDSN